MTRSATLICCSRAASDVRVERQRVLDEATVFQILLPPCDHVTALVEIGTCEVAVGERLFELLPRLDIEGCLLLLDLSLVIAANSLRSSSRVFASMSVRISSKSSRVVRLVARRLTGFDATQLPWSTRS